MNYEARRKLAQNPNTTLSDFIKLSKDKNWRIRYYVAKNPRIPMSLKVILRKDKHPLVRDAIENAVYKFEN